MVKMRFFMRVMSTTLAAIMLCGCGGKNADTKQDENLPESVESAETGESIENVEVTEPENADKAPDTVESEVKSDDIDYEAFYKPVLDEIYNAIVSGLDAVAPTSYVPSALEERLMYDPTSNILQTVGYRIEDISGDGFPELLIVDNEGGQSVNSVIDGIFTKKDDEIFITIDGWLRSSHYWIGDNRFGYMGSGGAYNTLYGIYRLSKDGTKSEWENFYFSEEVDGDIKYYTNKEGKWEIDNSEEADYNAALEFWDYLEAQYAPQLEITTFEAYGGQGNEQADASTYQSEKVAYFKIPEANSGHVEADLDGDGKSETIEYTMTDGDYYVESLTLSIDGKEYDLPKIDEAYAFALDGFDCFLLRPEGDIRYLYAQYTTDSDYTCTAVYSFDGDKFEYVDYIDGAVFFGAEDEEGNPVKIYPADPDNFQVMRVEMKLGTQAITEKCHLDKKGLPEPVEEYKYYRNYGEPYISAAKLIACYLYEDENATEGQPNAISEGNMVVPYRTDGKSFIDFKVEGLSGIYRVLIEQDENGSWTISYNEGMLGSLNLEDCFSGLIFAG